MWPSEQRSGIALTGAWHEHGELHPPAFFGTAPSAGGRPCWAVEGDGPSRAPSAHRHLLKRSRGFSSCDNENNRKVAFNSESFFCGCVLSG